MISFVITSKTNSTIGQNIFFYISFLKEISYKKSLELKKRVLNFCKGISLGFVAICARGNNLVALAIRMGLVK